MAKTKKRHGGHGGGFKLPLAVVAGFVPAVLDIVKVGKAGMSGGSGDFGGFLKRASHQTALVFTGFNTDDNVWYPGYAFGHAWLPIGLGFIVHKFIGGSLGVNRMLARAKIPFIRI